jgi:hypothetical protein
MKTFAFIISALLVSACSAHSSGQPSVMEAYEKGDAVISADFLTKYSGKFVDPSFNESLTIFTDGSFEREESRQVGREGDAAVPYPTLCSYKQSGRIVGAVRRSDENRNHYMDYASDIIVIQVTKVEMTAPLKVGYENSSNCGAFIAQESETIRTREYLQYSLYAELIDKDHFRLHTGGGGDSVQGKPRTESTLDESYTRISSQQK